MNLLDFTVTPLWLVWDAVRDLAAEDGVRLAESELIGLAPAASLLAVADHAGSPAERSPRGAPGRRGGLHPAARLLADAGPRTRGWRPCGQVPSELPEATARRRRERRAVPRHRGRPDRRADPGPPRRRRARDRDPRRRRPPRCRPGRRGAARGGRSSEPGGARRRDLGGAYRRGRSACGGGGRARRRRPPARAASPGSMRPVARSRRA